MTYHRVWFVTRVTRRVKHLEQEPLTLPGHVSSPPLFTCLNGVRVVQCCQISSLHVFSSVLLCSLRFLRK